MILVTGGTGLVGSHLIYDLLKKGNRVRATKRVSSNKKQTEKVISYYHKRPSELLNHLEWVNADILDVHSLEDAMVGVTQVFHCAAIISFNPFERQKMIENNIKGTANIVNACLNKKKVKLCHVSSISALGRDNTKETITEDVQWVYSKEQSAYAISKYESEREVWRGIAEGLNAIIVNPSIILGPGSWGKGSTKIFTRIYNGLKFYTNGITGYVDVRDVSSCMIQLMESNISNQRFLINAENLTYKELFSLIAKELNVSEPNYYGNKFISAFVWRILYMVSFFTGKSPLITKETTRTAYKKYFFSNKKIKKTINYSFIPIPQSIKDTAHLFLIETQN